MSTKLSRIGPVESSLVGHWQYGTTNYQVHEFGKAKKLNNPIVNVDSRAKPICWVVPILPTGKSMWLTDVQYWEFADWHAKWANPATTPAQDTGLSVVQSPASQSRAEALAARGRKFARRMAIINTMNRRRV